MAFDFTNCANTEQQVSLNNNALVCMPLDNRHVYGSVLKLVDCWRVFKNVLLGMTSKQCQKQRLRQGYFWFVQDKCLHDSCMV